MIKHLAVDEDTFDMVTCDCVREYLEHHPEDLKKNITQRFIVDKIARHYLQ